MSERRFVRYHVAHSEFVGGNVTKADSSVRLISLSLGGCGFFSPLVENSLNPSKEVLCSLFWLNDDQGLDSEVVLGNLIYVSPQNTGFGPGFLYGIRFHENSKKQLTKFIALLERLEQQGQLERL